MQIRVLPIELVNQIAAGEIIERPASVVKELVENAIDAHSHTITVSAIEGGIRQIGVQDDGDGMGREDATMAFAQHSTSKLHSLSGLSEIATLGFRGEALPSIASVSRVRLVTRERDAEEGTEVVLDADGVEKCLPIGAPCGSLFEVSDLFVRTPARLKFLKSAQTEFGHIRQHVFELALSHPMIHFRLSHNEKVVMEVPSVHHMKDRVLQLFGETITSRMVEAHEQVSPSLSVDVFLSCPPVRGDHKKLQHLFVNQRPIRNPLLSRAVYDAYGSFLMKGESPFFVLYLTLSPNAVDVNVHPTKKEVRFEQPERVYQSVKTMLRHALLGGGREASSAIASPVPEKVDAPLAGRSVPSRPRYEGRAPDRYETPRWIGWPTREPTAAHEASLPDGRQAPLPPLSALPLFEDTPSVRPLGQVYRTFLVAEIDGELALIDQHTAHERLLYEKLMDVLSGKEKGNLVVQPLLFPQQIEVSHTDAHALKDHLECLSSVGWHMEPFGETTFLLRATPAILSSVDAGAFLTDLADDLTLGVGTWETPIHQVAASMACHGAVRSGQALNLQEIEALLKEYITRKAPATCPHGRPILMRYPMSDLEKLFRRLK